jgi:hypothetical protein
MGLTIYSNISRQLNIQHEESYRSCFNSNNFQHLVLSQGMGDQTMASASPV